MARATASITVPGRAAEAEALWYDRSRWASWVDGFGHVARLDDSWPDAGARLVWDSPPGGRGRVVEEVVSYVVRSGQTVHVEDERLEGTQRVTFEPAEDQVNITLTLEFNLKQPRFRPAAIERYFVGRALQDSLRRTLTRFAHELRAEREL
jgi:Polyketide cyclase / dehydrase and lipid transport